MSELIFWNRNWFLTPHMFISSVFKITQFLNWEDLCVETQNNLFLQGEDFQADAWKDLCTWDLSSSHLGHQVLNYTKILLLFCYSALKAAESLTDILYINMAFQNRSVNGSVLTANYLSFYVIWGFVWMVQSSRCRLHKTATIFYIRLPI